MATKGPQTPQPVRRLCRGTTPPPAGKQNGLSQTPRSLQRSGSLRVKGEAARTAVQAPLRREKTADSLRPRPARAPRGTVAGPPSPEVVTSRGEVMTSRGACSLPQSPTLSRRSSAADSSWETQSVLNSSSPFSTEGISCNGTTFSSRHNKYLIHCAKRVDDEHYLTPTQRTTRDIKRLRGLLDKAHETIQQKDAEIHRLKQEVITLRLRSGLHVDSADPSDRLTPQPAGADPADLSHGVSDLSGDLGRLSEPNTPGTLLATSTPDTSSRLPAGEPPSVDTTDAAVLPSTGDAANLSCPASPRGVEAAVKPLLVPSVGDSGTFDCLTSPSISSKESVGRPAALELEERLGDDWEATEHWIEWEEKRLREESERRIAELNRQHGAEYQEMKEKYNDKVEGLLQKLTEANGRYFEIRPLYDASRLRVGQLELELEKALSRADRRADTRDISAQTVIVEQSRADTRHTSVQTAAAPARVAAESQTVAPPSPESVTTATMTVPEPATAAAAAESVPEKAVPEQPASNPGPQEPLSTFQQQHMATRPDNVPERIQVTAMVHSPAETPGDAPGEVAEKAAREAHGTREAANGDPEPELDWPSELVPPVTKQPQTVPPPSPDEPVQFAVPFTRYFAHVAAQGPSNPGKRSPMPNGGPQMAAQSSEETAQVAAPAAESDERVSELTQRLSQTETELERVRSLYCQQLALLEDSQRQSAAGEEGGRRTSLEMDPPMRLQFLKSAVFHYLTDKDDYVGHMRAISAVLQFSEWELQEVERVRARKTSHS